MLRTENKNSITEKQRLLYQTMDARDSLIKLIDYFPLYRLAKLLRGGAKLAQILYKVPYEVWEGIFNFLSDDETSMRDLKVKEARLILKALIAATELHLDCCDDEDEKAKLQSWIRKMNDTLQELESQPDQDAAFESMKRLRSALINNYPTVLRVLRDVFGAQVQELAYNTLKKMIPGMVIKGLIKYVVNKILTKKLGEEAAKRLAPLVGIGISLAEFTSLMVILNEIRDMQSLIDRLMAEIITQLIDEGHLKWPSKGLYIWIDDQPRFQGATATLTPYLYYLFQSGGEWKLSGNYCKTKFAQGGEIQEALTDANFDPVENVWKIHYSIDQNDAESTNCYESGDLVFLAVYCEIKKGAELLHKSNVLVGAVKR